MNYNSCWLTVNRACNLRCEWCYARGTDYKASDNMPLDMSYQIIDICKDLSIDNIVLIGGEPTIYPHFFEVVDYCHSKGIQCGIVTNGLIFSNNLFVEKMAKHNIKSLSISLKGEGREAFLATSKVDGFEDVITGIKNCLNAGIHVSVSMVITDNNVDTFLNGVRHCKSIGVDRFNFSFCNNFNDSGIDNNYLKLYNPKLLIKRFNSHVDELKEITNNKFSFHNIYPLCIWDNNDYEEKYDNNSIYTICQLLKKSGLIFDTEGYLIPCNAMYSVKLGRLNEDFTDAKSMLKYTNSQFIKKAYKKLCGVPDLSCLKCDKLKECGGGCVCQWTNYDFNQLMDIKNI